MKSFKRLITALLAIAMILTSVGIVAFADSSFSDIEDERVDEAVSRLVAYGIITGYDDDGDGVAESFKPNNQITRAEFAAIVTRMKGVADNLPKDSVTGFWDLDNDSSRAWARPYVKAAADMGIINGFEDGSFRAADPVTYEQAVKMLVCAIGYETVAKSEYNKAIAINPKATWSAGYIAAANKHGITRNVMTSQITLPANRGTVAILTSNSYDVPKLEEDEHGNLVKPENGSGAESEGNMITIAGYVTDTFYTGLDTDDTGLNEDEIIIDAEKKELDGKYTISRKLLETIDLDKYIGRKVTAYYDNLEGEITSIRLENMTSKIIEEQYIVSASSTQIKTEDEDERTSTENINGATFIVNGKYVEDYDFDGFENGTVEIFSALGKKIVVVSDYEVFVTLRLDKNNDKLFIKYDTYDNDDDDEEENYYQFPARNSDKPLIYVKASGSSSYKLTSYDSLSLSQYDIVNYLESPADSAGNPVRKMYVTKGSKSGKVTSSFSDGRMVELDNKIMYLTQQYYDFEGTSNDKKAPFAISDNYTYYVDCNGQIAAVNYNETTSGSAWAYGYIVDVYPRDKEIGILQTNGDVKYYTLKDKVKVDGKKEDTSDVYSILKEAAEEIDANANAETLSDTDGYAQPIKYSISGGEIEGLDTVISNSDSPVRGDDFTYDGQLGSSAGSTSTSKVTVDGVSYGVNSTTFVLYVPKDRSDEDSYAKMTASTAFAVTKNRYVEVFGVDDSSSNKLAKMVIVYGTNPTLNFIGNSPYLIVTGKGSSDENDTIKGYKNGSEKETTVVVSEDKFTTDLGTDEPLVSVSEIERGDIVRYITDSKGEAIAMEMVYDKSEGELSYTTKDDEAYISKTEGAGSDFVAIMGTITNKDTTDSKVTVETGTDKERIHRFNSNTKVFKLLTSGSVEISSMEEVYDGADGMDSSTVLLITTSVSTEATAQTIYIIE